MRRLIHRRGLARTIRPSAGLAAVLVVVLLQGCGGTSDEITHPPTGFDAARAFADLRTQVELGPRPSGGRAARRAAVVLADALRDAGASGVRIQSPLRNVVATIPGQDPGYVVLGAHYDTKPGIPGFQGANDGASGVAIVLELARVLPRPMPGPAVAIVLFDGEEARGERDFLSDGMRGSRQYVALAGGPPKDRQGSPPLEEVEAMMLLDMVGDCDLEIPREGYSDASLYAHFAATDPETFSGEVAGVQDDHLPFLQAGVPAVNLIDFAYGPGPRPGDWWHSPQDTIERVCAESLGKVGAAVERGLWRLDELG